MEQHMTKVLFAYETDRLREHEAVPVNKEYLKRLFTALEQMVWRDRHEFPGDPYCVLCGAGKRWARTHGHQPKCALSSRAKP